MMDAVSMLAELVSISSVTGTAGEKQAIEWLERELASYGIPSEHIGVPERPNLVARMWGSNPSLRPLVLLSHIDVVPAEEAQWKHPPFGGKVEDGRLYGRGTLDTKQLTIMELIAFLKLNASGHPKRDVVLIATVDEEKGSMLGAARLAEEKPDLFHGAIAISEGGGFPIIVNSKSYLTMTIGEKASCRVKLTAEGQSGHAGAPGTDQAVVKLARALAKVLECVNRLEKGGATAEAMAACIGKTPENKFAAELLDYSGSCGVAIQPFKIGEKVNVLPADATLSLELRPLPGTTQAQVEGWLNDWLREEDAAYKIESFQPGCGCEPESKHVKRIMASVEQSASRHGLMATVLPMLALGRTDGRFFSEGSSVFGFSPLGLEDTFDAILPKVHGVDESVNLSGFTMGCEILADLVHELAMEVED